MHIAAHKGASLGCFLQRYFDGVVEPGIGEPNLFIKLSQLMCLIPVACGALAGATR